MGWDARWRQLANTIKRYVHDSDAGCLSPQQQLLNYSRGGNPPWNCPLIDNQPLNLDTGLRQARAVLASPLWGAVGGYGSPKRGR